MNNPRSIVAPVAIDRQFQWKEPLDPCDLIRHQFVNAQINFDKLCESVWRQVQIVWETGATPTDLLLGRDFYGRFLGDVPAYERPWDFHVPMEYSAPVYPDTFRMVFAGLHVHCIPWMEGVVVTPALTSVAPKPFSTNDWSVQLDGESIVTPASAVPETTAPPGLVRGVLQELRQSFNKWLDKPKPFVRPGKHQEPPFPLIQKDWETPR